jgi:hypothetical protein
VGHGKHPGERGPRQQCRFPGLHPLPRGKHLALRTVAIATGIIRVPLAPTGRTVCGVPTELRRPAGLDVVHPLLRRGGDGMGTAISRPIAAEHSGDFPRWGVGLAHGWRLWASGGMRWHALTPAWAGGAPRRAGGRTGCGSSPDAGG